MLLALFTYTVRLTSRLPGWKEPPKRACADAAAPAAALTASVSVTRQRRGSDDFGRCAFIWPGTSSGAAGPLPAREPGHNADPEQPADHAGGNARRLPGEWPG